MARFYGVIGYALSKETSPGIWEDEEVERNYCGNVERNSSRWQTSETLNDDLNINNQISIVADPFAYENFHAMRYVNFMGVSWKITNVEVRRPRLILTIGGVYNGK